MFSKISINSIFLIVLATNVVLRDQNSGKQSNLLQNKRSSGFLNYLISRIGPELFSDNDLKDKYNYLHAHKFTTPLLLEKCIKFHDSEIVKLDLSRMIGRWDQHLSSFKIPVDYDHAISHYDEKKDVGLFKFEPTHFKSFKSVRNDSKMLRSVFVFDEYLGLKFPEDEAMISTDHNSYFIKYSCVEVLGNVSGSLHFQLRPEATDQLNTNPNLFSLILDRIPEKSLIKINHLIPKLIHQNNRRFESFGKDYNKTLTKRLNRYLRDNQLSGKRDDEVFLFLKQNCDHFRSEELVVPDLSTIGSSNWRLDFANVDNEKIPFNRMSIKRLSNNTFAVSLFEGMEIKMANSDQYYDPAERVFWTFTEGRRSRDVILHSSPEYIIVYCCEETQNNENLEFNEKLRYFSSENSTIPGTMKIYFELLKRNLKPTTLKKVTDLHKNVKSAALPLNPVE